MEFSAFPSGGSVAEVLQMQFQRTAALVPFFQNSNKSDQVNNTNENKRKKWGIEADSDVTLPDWCMTLFISLFSLCSFQIEENEIFCPAQ